MKPKFICVRADYNNCYYEGDWPTLKVSFHVTRDEAEKMEFKNGIYGPSEVVEIPEDV